jgi:hypothetical protein
MNEYWVVTEDTTGRVICQCGDINDAMMMVSFSPQNRSYKRHRFLMDQIVDISYKIDKQLPGQLGLPQGQVPVLQSYREKLPEGEGIVFDPK